MNSRFFTAFNLKGFKWLLQLSVIVAALVAMPAHSKTLLKTIVVFGDSLSAAYNIPQHEGWVALLQQRLDKQNLSIKKYNYQVVNASISGETTSGGLSRFTDMLATHKPQVVVLELGGNDGLRGLSAADTYNNLEVMIQRAQAKKIKVLLLGMKIPPNYGIKYSRQFSENYQNLAKKYNIKLVPFFLDGVAGNPKLIQADGLHPTATAQPQLLENVWPTLVKILKN